VVFFFLFAVLGCLGQVNNCISQKVITLELFSAGLTYLGS
jgi:hypothetical protein